jgi:subtilisin-like proprotein convertase family protein
VGHNINDSIGYTNMKTKILAVALAMMTVCAQATLYTFTWSSGFDAGSGVVPDANLAGWADTRTVDLGVLPLDGTTDIIQDVNVRLNISGGYNGDLYGYLVHSSGFAVLLNRVGRTGTDAFGYGDAGFNITLGAVGGTDIHNYGGNGGSQLVGGSWLEDGRNANPASVTDQSSRNALLSSFNTSSANDEWTLFLADMSGGDISTVVSWGLDIEVVPEPITCALGIFGGAFGLLKLVRHLRRRK